MRKVLALVLLAILLSSCVHINTIETYGTVKAKRFNPAHETTSWNFILDGDGNIVSTYPITTFYPDSYRISLSSEDCGNQWQKVTADVYANITIGDLIKTSCWELEWD